MCPFSHGAVFGFSISLCLLLWNVNGSAVVERRPRDQSRIQRPWSGSKWLSFPPQQPTVTVGSDLVHTVKSDNEALNLAEENKQKDKLNPVDVAFIQRQNNRQRQLRDPKFKRSFFFTVSLNHQDSSEYMKHKRNGLHKTSDSAPVAKDFTHRGWRIRPGLLEHIRKHKTVHPSLKSCRVCIKLDRTRTRTPREFQKHRPQKSDRAELWDHKQRHWRTDCGKSRNCHSRLKRSVKRNKHMKVKRSSRLTINESVTKTSPLTSRQNNKLRIENAKSAAEETTDITTIRPTTVRTDTSQLPPKKTSNSVTPKTVNASQEPLKMNWTSSSARKGMETSEPRFGGESQQGHGTSPDTSIVAQGLNSSSEDSEADSATYLGLDGKPVDLKELIATLQKKEFQRQLNREAQWAYFLLVMLLCLMMWTVWCLGGLERCRYRPDDVVRFTDIQALVTVKEVLKSKRQYLPMFNDPEWEEVLMCNRGSDP